MLKLIILFTLISLLNSQIIRRYDQMQHTLFLAKSLNLELDTTHYSVGEKTKIIDNAFLESDAIKIRNLYFYNSDTNINQQTIDKWILTLYNEKLYQLINMYFAKSYPKNQHVVRSYYHLKKYDYFLAAIKNLIINSDQLLFYKINSLFNTNQLLKLIKEDIPEGNRYYSIKIKQLFFRSFYKLKKFKEAIDIGKTFLSNDEIPNEIYLMLAIAYMNLEQFELSEFSFKYYENLMFNEDIDKFQTGLVYHALMYQLKGDIDSSIGIGKKAIYVNPNNIKTKATVYKNLASYYESIKDYKLAIYNWERYIHVSVSNERRDEAQSRVDWLKEKQFFSQSKKKSN